MIDENLPRWITASINTHLKTAYNYVFVKGEVINSDSLTSWAEVRIVGPKLRELSNSKVDVEVYIDVICNAKETNDLYLVERIAGKFVNALRTIPVKKFGNNPATKIGCLEISDEIETVPYGLINSKIRQYQTVVSCRMLMLA